MIRYKKISSEFFSQNRNNLYQAIGEKGIFILPSAYQSIRNGDQYYLYRQNSDTFYFSGLEQEKTILIFCPTHPIVALREIALIIEPDEKMLVWQGHKYSQKEVSEVSGIDTVRYLVEFDNIILELFKHTNKVYTPFGFNQRLVSETENPVEKIKKKLKELKQDIVFCDVSETIQSLRLVKSEIEIGILIEACNITKKSFSSVLKNIKPGINEYQIEAVLTHDFIYHGASGHAYPPIVASGKNACVLHYNSNHDICKSGDLLLLDFGAEYANYAADCSRTIPINGKFSKRQLQVYNSVLSVFKEIRKQFVPGQTINIINKKTDELIEEQLLILGLITKDEILNQDEKNPICKKYFPHGTSHFLGLDVHDVGGKDVVFEKGMVLTCEPGIYIPEENIGVRIENDILIDETPIDLMAEIPIEAEEIEGLISS